MKPDQRTLYILSDAPHGDPLDCVAAATPLLAQHYTAIHQVGPDRALSERSLRRAFQPGLDCLLYDFTSPDDHSWAFNMLKDTPAAVLLGGLSPVAPTGALANLRSARRYAANGLRFSSDTIVGVLDAPPDPKTWSLPRPNAAITPATDTNDLILAVAPGAIETTYAVMRGLMGVTAPMTILTANRPDANDLTDIIAAFGMADARVQYVRSRKGLVAATVGVGGLIDISDNNGTNPSDAAFVARSLGAPVLELKTSGGAGKAAAAFTNSKPQKDPIAAKQFVAERPIAAFASNLHALIETGFTYAQKTAAA